LGVGNIIIGILIDHFSHKSKGKEKGENGREGGFSQRRGMDQRSKNGKRRKLEIKE